MTEERRKEFIDFIDQKNIRQIRISIESVNSLDPNGERGEVDERLELLKGRVSDDELYEKHDDELFPILPKDIWDEDYFNKQKVKLQRNFSKERLEHVRELGKFIFPPKEKISSSKNEEVKNNTQKKSSKNSKLVIAGLIAAGVIAAVLLA